MQEMKSGILNYKKVESKSPHVFALSWFLFLKTSTTEGRMDILSEGQNWVDEINEQVENLNKDQESSHWNQHSIYRVPTFLIDHLDKKAYKPQVASFGPYHYGEDHLKSMELHKLRALRHFLKRSRKDVKEFLNALREVDKQLKDCYEQLEEPWIKDNDQFSRLMLRDGCFMLKILRTSVAEKYDIECFRSSYALNDPIFSSHGNVHWLPFITNDMMMLENQLPLLVLEKLVAVETGRAQSHRLMINWYVLRLLSRQSWAQDMPFTHVLDVVRDSFVRFSNNPISVDQVSESSAAEIVRSATDTHWLDINADSSVRTSSNPSSVDQVSESSAVKIVRSATETHRLVNVGDRSVRTSSNRSSVDQVSKTSAVKIVLSVTELFTRMPDVVRNRFVRISRNPSSVDQVSESSAVKIVLSATELFRSGVRFKRSETRSYKDVNFRDGFLSLPVIVVNDDTKSMLLTLMANERSHEGAGLVVTSYVFLMDNLIDDARDLRILRSKGIVENALGSDEDVVSLFNALALDVTYDLNSELQDVQRRVNEYCKRRWSVPESNPVKIVRSATELSVWGVRFKVSETTCFTDVNFHDGFLSLPKIIVDDGIESMLLNLMAYERSHVGARSHITSYVLLMDNLIDGVLDVEILRSKGIVEDALGSDEAVAKLFNDLALNVTYNLTSRFLKVKYKVNDYYLRRRNCMRRRKVCLRTLVNLAIASRGLGAAFS